MVSLKYLLSKEDIKMAEMRATLQGGNWSGVGHAEIDWSLKKYTIRRTVDSTLT